ncbi:glycosyltransferase family 4 protein [bacterium]|nr:glycosyltransferase family 4 protein [bacterium]
MKIVNILPGTGDSFYCENCIRDISMVKGLRQLGHDVTMVPMYLPLSFDELNLSGNTPIFFGAVNLYLKQMMPFFRKAPRWLNQVLDSSAMLKFAAKKSGSTQASGLEEMTLSMIRGEDGNQAAELNQLISWLKKEIQPDIIHLANILLIGLARRIKEELGVPVVCSLQDEHVWIDAMNPDYSKQIWETVAERAADVDAFIAVSRFYSHFIKERLKVNADKMHVVPISMDLTDFKSPYQTVDPPVIGYLSRICEAHGLDRLIEAFVILKKNEKLRNLRLHATGGQLGEDKKFIKTIRKKLSRLGLQEDVHFYPEFDRKSRIDFLQSLSVLSVPMKVPTAIGAFQIEAIAAGVPVVQPRIGGFTEFIEETGGGILYEPNDTETLASVLKSLLLDPDRAKKLVEQGQRVVYQKYSYTQVAEDLIQVYNSV